MTALALVADSGDTAWLLAASALVLLMAPGLALFYGGMVRSKSVLNMIMMTFGALAVIVVVWVLFGYSLAFGDDLGGGLVGDPFQHFGLSDLMKPGEGTVPTILFAVFQGLFCVITGALISGAIADRARFGAWLVFVAIWTVVVYAPVAHWIFDFSAGSALHADQAAAIVFTTTLVAGAAGTLGWLAVERLRDGHATSLGAASGMVAGLVAITPSCGSLSPLGALVMGAAAGGICAWAVGLKYKLGYDDSLDVVGVHMVGGIVGTLGIGLIATSAAPTAVDGLFYGGGVDQLGKQTVGVGAVLVYSSVVSGIIGVIVDKVMGFRIDQEHEVSGIDLIVHAETAYDLHATAGARSTGHQHLTKLLSGSAPASIGGFRHHEEDDE